MDYLKSARSPKAVEALSELLRHAMEDEATRIDAGSLAQILTGTPHPRVLPVLEEAALSGNYRAIVGVGQVGDTDSFRLLMELLPPARLDRGVVANALHWMVLRSSLPTEDWMDILNPTDDELQDVKRRWRLWWMGNQHALRIVHSNTVAQQRWREGLR